MVTTVDLIKIADRIVDLTADERVRLGRIMVHKYASLACDLQDGIEDGFNILKKELELV
jgi:hypothetical protein